MHSVAAQNFLVCNDFWNAIAENGKSDLMECVWEKPMMGVQVCTVLRCNAQLLREYAPGCARYQREICKSAAQNVALQGYRYCASSCSDNATQGEKHTEMDMATLKSW